MAIAEPFLTYRWITALTSEPTQRMRKRRFYDLARARLFAMSLSCPVEHGLLLQSMVGEPHLGHICLGGFGLLSAMQARLEA